MRPVKHSSREYGVHVNRGLSSARLAEALGVSQPTAWRIGHALRLMVAREHMLDGTIELDHFYLGGKPERQPDAPSPGRDTKDTGHGDCAAPGGNHSRLSRGRPAVEAPDALGNGK